MSTNKINFETAQRYFKSRRAAIGVEDVNKKMPFEVASKPTIVDVEDSDGNPVMEANGSGAILQKAIINFSANSIPAVKACRPILKDALAKEQAGDLDGASEDYNDYLNKVQVTGSILSTNPLFQKVLSGEIDRGTDLIGRVIEVDAKNGKTIALESNKFSVKALDHARKGDVFNPFTMEIEPTVGASV